MAQTIRLKTSLFFSALLLVVACRNKERIFITRSTPTRDIIAYHYDRCNEKDLFITFNIDRYARKVFKKRLFSVFFKLLHNSSFNRNNKRSFILCNIESQATVDLIKYLYPNATIYGKYVDIMSCFFKSKAELLSNTGGCYEIDSYSKEDCQIFNLKYIPDLANIDRLNALIKKTEQQNIILFIGVYSKVRFKSLCNFLEKFGTYDIKFKFKLLFEHDSDLNEQLPTINDLNQRFTYKPIEVLRNFISYEEYLTNLAGAVGIIDFYRVQKDEGHSFRVLECVAANKKLITNRELKCESFYNKDLIFNIDEDTTEDFAKFLESRAVYDKSELISFQSHLSKGYLPE